ILPWPGGGDVHRWHPDYLEARLLLDELAKGPPPSDPGRRVLDVARDRETWREERLVRLRPIQERLEERRRVMLEALQHLQRLLPWPLAWRKAPSRLDAGPAQEMPGDRGHAAGEAFSSERPPRVVDRPRWCRDNRRPQLRYGNAVLLEAGREAPMQFMVLDAMEAAGWPPGGIPIPTGMNRHQAKDAVRELNQRLASSKLVFRLQQLNVGSRIMWVVSSS